MMNQLLAITAVAENAVEAGEKTMKLGFTTEHVPKTLEMMGKGMLGIFVALFVIYLAVIVLKKLFPPKEEEQ